MKQILSRRTMLRLGAGTFGMAGMGGRLSRLGMLNAAVSPTTPNYKAMVCIFLFGGNDSNNMVIPIKTASQDYSTYSAVRGTTLSLAQAQLVPISSGTDQYGLHPRLAPLATLYGQGKLAIAANVGTLVKPLSKAQYQQGNVPVPTNLFSHSDQQQQWQTAPSPTSARTGWGGRAADFLASINSPSTFPTGVSTAGQALFLTGQNSTPATVSNGGLGLDGSDGSTASDARDTAFQQVLSFDTGLALIQSVNTYLADGIKAGKELNAALQSGGTLTTVFPNTGLGNQLQQVAQILKIRQTLQVNRQIFFVSQGGYDTHTDEIPTQDALFNELGPAMAAFYAATQELGLQDQVVTFTESDFSRTFQPSTGAGSDHAWGGHHFIMGPVQAAKIYGTFPQLSLDSPDDVSGRGVWLPTLSLDQYAATLASWFGVPDNALTTVLPNLVNFPTQKVGFL